MNCLNAKKRCLKEILAAVTPEDEKRFFLGLEYVKNYNGIVIGPVHKDGYGNECDLMPMISFNVDPEWTWGAFKEAKKILEKSAWKVFRLKKGIKIAFKHEMMLPDYYYDDDPKPKWITLYGEWFKNR